MSGLLSWSVQQLHRDLSRKSKTASSIVAQVAGRTEEIKELNAFVTVITDTASQHAKQVDGDLGRGKRLPLSAVPIAVKDNFCVKGVRTTCGSKMLKNFIPSYSATVVNRLQEAGAVIVGKTNLDEFGMGSGCVDSVHGVTVNAWNPDCIAGGSSGGSAVAVASGAAVAALGSDTGGSTRNPASYNGVIGLKPSYGLVSRAGLIPLVNSMDVPGIMARRVDDVVEVLKVISGWDRLDSTTIQRPIDLSVGGKLNIKNLLIGIPTEYYTEHLSVEVADTWKNVAGKLAAAGAKVVEVQLPHTKHSIAVYSVLNQCEVASNMARYTGLTFGLRSNNAGSTEQMYAQSRVLGLGDVVRRRIICGNYFLLAKNYDEYFLKALKVRRRIIEDFENVWKSVDLLLTPVTLSDAPLIQNFLSRDSRTQSVEQDYCTQPANMAGIPAISIPIRLSSRGLPLSLQLMAPHFGESILLQTARYLENLVDFSQHRGKGKFV